jgi:hypothetical protein
MSKTNDFDRLDVDAVRLVGMLHYPSRHARRIR